VLKHSYNFIKEFIEKENYILISKTYKNCETKLSIECENGHIYKTTFSIFRSGSRCPICYRKNQSKSMMKDFSIIKQSIEEQGFILLSSKTEYRGNSSKLKVICPNGHKIDICWSDFSRSKYGCPICAGCNKYTIEEIRKTVEKFGYKCLSKTYKNIRSKIKFECPLGHKYETTWPIFKNGSRCPECEKIKRSIKYSGPNCNFWKGGISTEPYCYEWTPEHKKLIKDRDGNICLNPTCCSGNWLTCHHVDYNKKNCCKENLITICRSCNSKANFDRNWHILWYQAILNKRYGYQY
jgi:hypothetical protein